MNFETKTDSYLAISNTRYLRKKKQKIISEMILSEHKTDDRSNSIILSTPTFIGSEQPPVAMDLENGQKIY